MTGYAPGVVKETFTDPAVVMQMLGALMPAVVVGGQPIRVGRALSAAGTGYENLRTKAILDRHRAAMIQELQPPVLPQAQLGGPGELPLTEEERGTIGQRLPETLSVLERPPGTFQEFLKRVPPFEQRALLAGGGVGLLGESRLPPAMSFFRELRAESEGTRKDLLRGQLFEAVKAQQAAPNDAAARDRLVRVFSLINADPATIVALSKDLGTQQALALLLRDRPGRTNDDIRQLVQAGLAPKVMEEHLQSDAIREKNVGRLGIIAQVYGEESPELEMAHMISRAGVEVDVPKDLATAKQGVEFRQTYPTFFARVGTAKLPFSEAELSKMIQRFPLMADKIVAENQKAVEVYERRLSRQSLDEQRETQKKQFVLTQHRLNYQSAAQGVQSAEMALARVSKAVEDDAANFEMVKGVRTLRPEKKAILARYRAEVDQAHRRAETALVSESEALTQYATSDPELRPAQIELDLFVRVPWEIDQILKKPGRTDTEKRTQLNRLFVDYSRRSYLAGDPLRRIKQLVGEAQQSLPDLSFPPDVGAIIMPGGSSAGRVPLPTVPGRHPLLPKEKEKARIEFPFVPPRVLPVVPMAEHQRRLDELSRKITGRPFSELDPRSSEYREVMRLSEAEVSKPGWSH